MNFIIKAVDGTRLEVAHFLSYELNQSISIPCDSLTVRFLPEVILPELETIEAWQGETLLFNGVVDLQQIAVNDSGATATLFARSTACYLVDNACVPCAYNQPSTTDLFLNHGAPFGLRNRLPCLMLDKVFTIASGSSHWKVIDAVVQSVSNYQIYVNSANELCVFAPTGRTHRIANNGVGSIPFLSACVKARRSGVVATVLYKTEQDHRYCYRAQRPDLLARHITTSRCLNLSSLPPWMRGSAVKKVIEDSLKQQFALEVTVQGDTDFYLYDRVDFAEKDLGSYDGLLIGELCYRCDQKGQRCELTLCQHPSGEEEVYVD